MADENIDLRGLACITRHAAHVIKFMGETPTATVCLHCQHKIDIRACESRHEPVLLIRYRELIYHYGPRQKYGGIYRQWSQIPEEVRHALDIVRDELALGK